MASKIVQVEGIGEVTLIKRRGNSHIRLSFDREGRTRVSLPAWLPYQAGVDFVATKRDWISRHRPTAPLTLQDGDRIGKAHRLKLLRGGQAPRVSVRNNSVIVTCPVDTPSTSISVKKAIERGALKALKSEADKLLPQRLDDLAKKFGFKYNTVATKRLSSRWGSCSQMRDIILNIYLMQLPWNLIDYVIIHELTHTEHLNHGPSFWQRVVQCMPDARSRRKELKAYKTTITASPY